MNQYHFCFLRIWKQVRSFYVYNSLDLSSKFYTENEMDENGKTLAVFDESGEHTGVFVVKHNIAPRLSQRASQGLPHHASYGGYSQSATLRD